MPSAMTPNPRANQPDALDDLFDYDAGIDETFNQSNDHATAQPTQRPSTHGDLHQSTLDEEIKITRKRAPVAKLDEDLLLSRKGLPKLRGISKTMKFKGKGHEFSDMSRLLNAYQLWLDDLFPKAKFADGLSMVEKKGHTKRVQLMRREWIEESKPKPANDSSDEEEVVEEAQTTAQDSTSRPDVDVSESVQQSHGPVMSGANGESPHVPDAPNDDELDALLAEESLAATEPASLFGNGNPVRLNETQPPERVDFADEEEAMADIDW